MLILFIIWLFEWAVINAFQGLWSSGTQIVVDRFACYELDEGKRSSSVIWSSVWVVSFLLSGSRRHWQQQLHPGLEVWEGSELEGRQHRHQDDPRWGAVVMMMLMMYPWTRWTRSVSVVLRCGGDGAFRRHGWTSLLRDGGRKRADSGSSSQLSRLPRSLTSPPPFTHKCPGHDLHPSVSDCVGASCRTGQKLQQGRFHTSQKPDTSEDRLIFLIAQVVLLILWV